MQMSHFELASSLWCVSAVHIVMTYRWDTNKMKNIHKTVHLKKVNLKIIITSLPNEELDNTTGLATCYRMYNLKLKDQTVALSEEPLSRPPSCPFLG